MKSIDKTFRVEEKCWGRWSFEYTNGNYKKYIMNDMKIVKRECKKLHCSAWKLSLPNECVILIISSYVTLTVISKLSYHVEKIR